METHEAWRNWAGAAHAHSARAEWASATLPAMLRRRIGTFAQRAISAALGCAGATPSRYIFASRHGELGRTVGILGAIAAGETPSPTEFSMSVHHALAGLLSIHTGNREGHTAVAAGVDTFGFGFMEAAAYVAADAKPALLVYYDDALPEEYRALDAPDDALPLVVAVRLEPAGSGKPRCAFAPAPTTAPPRSGISTTAAALDFLRFLLSGEAAAVSIGRRMTWRWLRAD
ncbi:beta-ketoacyl synthase chain length factor [Dongia sp. agr-C8]